MKSKTSLFKKAVFKRNIRGSLGLWIGLLLLYLFCMPLPAYLRLSYEWLSNMPKDELILYKADILIENIWMMPMFVPIFALAALVAAMALFSYLFTGRNANMMHTFPVSRLSLLCTNYVTGLLFLIIPQVVALLFTLLIGTANGALTTEVIKYSLMWLGIAAGESWFFFSMAVCVLMFAGNIVAVPVFYFIINFLYQGCKFIFAGMLSTVCYGLMNAGGQPNSSDLFTPMLYMSRHILLRQRSTTDGDRYVFAGGTAFLIYLAAAFVFLIISIIVYEKKHLETAGDVITVGWLKPIFRWGAAICTSALGTLFLFAVIGYKFTFVKILCSVTVLGIIAFFVAQMVLERSMRVFTKAKVREGIVFIVFMCVAYVALDSDVLGIEKKIPQKDEIQSVRINGAVSLFAQSADEIAWAMDIHKQIIDSKKEFSQVHQSDFAENIAYLSLTYCLEDDKTMERSYYIPIEESPESVSGQIQALASKPEIIFKEYFGIHYPQVRVYGCTLNIYNNEDYSQKSLEQEEAEQVYQAVIKDVQEGNFARDSSFETSETEEVLGSVNLNIHDEQGFATPSDIFYGHVQNQDGVAEIWLTSSHKNLIKTLKKIGYDPYEMKTSE